jgi:hypothetical protein
MNTTITTITEWLGSHLPTLSPTVEICIWILGFMVLVYIASQVPGLLLVLNKKNVFCSPATNGDIKFFERGGNIYRVAINYKDNRGYAYFNESTGKIEFSPKSPLGFFERLLGIYFLWGYWLLNERVHTYRFGWNKLCDKDKIIPTSATLVEQRVLEGKILASRKEDVSVMRFVWIYPIYADKIEIQGNFKISILFNVTIEIVKPLEIISLLKGDWYFPLSDEIVGRVTDYVRDIDIDDFRALDKTDDGCDFVKKVKNHIYLDGRVKITNVAYVGFDYNDNPPEVIAAFMERERLEKIQAAKLLETQTIQKQKLEAATSQIEVEKKIAESQEIINAKELKTARMKADAEAYEIEQKARALMVNPSSAVIERARLLSEGMKEHKGTLVLGNTVGTFGMNEGEGNSASEITTSPPPPRESRRR